MIIASPNTSLLLTWSPWGDAFDQVTDGLVGDFSNGPNHSPSFLGVVLAISDDHAVVSHDDE